MQDSKPSGFDLQKYLEDTRHHRQYGTVRIALHTKALVSDPAHLILWSDVDTGAAFSDLTPVKEIIANMERDAAYDAGYVTGVSRVLENLGISREEYFRKTGGGTTSVIKKT